MDLRGKLIDGTFQLEQRLGSGAAGDVYLAKLVRQWQMLSPGSEVALKHYKDWLFEEGGEKQSERISREALLAEIRDENLVQIHGVGSSALGDIQLHYLVMEFVHGKTLTDFITHNSPLAAGQIKAIMTQLCKGVVALHQRGNVHRDIKPDNIMVIGNQQPAIKLMDFGVISDFDRPAVTESHEFLGTVRYAAPEWILGHVDQSQSSQILLDLYSLGAVLADLINGYPLFPKVISRFQLAALKTQSEPQVVRNDIPVSFITIAQRLIAIKPQERRPTTAIELLQIVENLDASERTGLAEEDLERSLARFNTLRTNFKGRQALKERASKEKESVINEARLICVNLRNFLAGKFQTEEWEESIGRHWDRYTGITWDWAGRVSFGISANEAEAVLFPMTISIFWGLTETFELVAKVAGFYSWVYYSRRGWEDGLARQTKQNWQDLLHELDQEDEVYHDKYIKQAVEEGLKKGLLKLVEVFLQVNKAEIFARETGLKLALYRLNKFRYNGEILTLASQSGVEKDERCAVEGCTVKRKPDSFLCPPHDQELLLNAE